MRDKLDLVANEAGVTDSGVLHHAKLVKVKGVLYRGHEGENESRSTPVMASHRSLSLH
jgi:hypothetical protein